jgi:xanthine dehydrogenase YagS FAD-binding subunit
MQDRAALPQRLLDINHLPDMARVEALPDRGLPVGALARMSDVAADVQVRRRFPVIAESLLFAPSGRSATWPRSAATSCSGRVAPISVTRMVFRATGGGRAPAARTASIANTRSSDGPMPALPPTPPTWRWHLQRSTRMSLRAGLLANDRSNPERDNVLERGDLIIAIEVPAQVEGRASHYLKLRDRQSYEFALVSAGAAVATVGRHIGRHGSPWAASRTSPGA